MQRLPAMRQEFGDEMVFVRGQTLQHIFEISVRVVLLPPPKRASIWGWTPSPPRCKATNGYCVNCSVIWWITR